MKTVCFIYNPYSGKQEIDRSLDRIIATYQNKGYYVLLVRIDKDVNLKETFNRFKEGKIEFDHILIAGGDGTINNIINIMLNSGLNYKLAFLPTGTANDFAKAIGMKADLIEENILQIVDSDEKKIDIGLANDRYFINILSTGVFTDISQKVPGSLKQAFGKMAYFLTSIKELKNIKDLNIQVDAEEASCEEDKYLMFVFNGRTAGNIEFAYRAELDDGLFDVIILKAKGIRKSINIFFKILNGTYLDDEEVVSYFKTDRLTIDSEEDIVVDIDGERGPNFPLEIKCLKEHLTILGYR